MIFDTMKPAFILQLAVFGTLCIFFMLAGVRAAVQSNGQFASKLKAAAFLSLTVVFAAAFIGTTAPSQRYFVFMRVLLLSAGGLSAVICTAAAAVYLRKNKAFFEPVIHYKDFLDDIDDYIFIFDSSGEQVLQNNPNGREKLSPGYLQAIPAQLLSGEDCDMPRPDERKILWDDRYYMVSSSVIRDKKQRKAGVALLFHDITREQQLIDELEMKNELLARTNEELVHAIAVDEALLGQAQRERLAAEIRQELDAKMSRTLRYIDTLKRVTGESRAQKAQHLSSLAGRLRGVLADIRKIVYKTKEN